MSYSSSGQLTEKLMEILKEQNFDVFGFVGSSEFEGYRLHDSVRRNPMLSMPDAKTIIINGIYIGNHALSTWNNPDTGRTSRLFLSGYFNAIVEKSNQVAEFLVNEGYNAIVCNDNQTDSSVIPLKLAALRAGLGWQGKHTLLVNRKFGSFLALGGIITNANLETEEKSEKNMCLNCNICQKACPVGALNEDFILDKTKCISWLLQNENFPQNLGKTVKNRIMDCEICQDVCPWNKDHVKNPMLTNIAREFQEKKEYLEKIFRLVNLAEMTENEYDKTIGCFNTGIPYGIFSRNVKNAISNLEKQ